MDGSEDEAREHWLETYSSLSDSFVSKIARWKSIVPSYERNMLPVVEEYLRKEFKSFRSSILREFVFSFVKGLPLTSQRVSDESLFPFVEVLAYLCRVIVLNFGGRPVFHLRTGMVTVEDVAGLGVVALPALWLNRAIYGEETGVLECYYDRVDWLVNRLKTRPFNIDYDGLWNVMRNYGYKHHSLNGELLRVNMYQAGTIACVSFCPDCNRPAHVSYIPILYEAFTDLGELVKNIYVAVFETAEWPCPSCKGQCLPLGYSFSTLVKKGTRGSVLSDFTDQLPESWEGVLTVIVTSLGKGLVLTSPLKRYLDNSVSGIEEPAESPLLESQTFLMLPSTPFCT